MMSELSEETPDMPHTLLLELPEDIYEALVRTATQTGQPVEEWAIERLTAESQRLADDPFEKFIGAISSDIPDWADNHDYYIGRSLMEDISNPRKSDANG